MTKDIDKITKLYESGLSSYKIAVEFNVSPVTILNRLKKNSVLIRPRSKRNNKFNDKILDQILSLFDSGWSVSKISRKYGCSITTISDNLKKNNRKVIRPEELNKSDWSFVKDKKPFFYYWLGWMIADGCVCERRHGGRNRGIMSYLTVHKDDDHILEFIKDKIYKQKKISHKKDNTSRLDISVPRSIYNELKLWGLIPNKTYMFKTTKNLDNMNKRQFMQFLVGFTEGDGSVEHRKMKSRGNIYDMLRIRWSGGDSSDVLKFIIDKLFKFGFKKRKLQTQTNLVGTTKTYAICGGDAIRLCESLLDCRYHELDRKWDKCRFFRK